MVACRSGVDFALVLVGPTTSVVVFLITWAVSLSLLDSWALLVGFPVVFVGPTTPVVVLLNTWAVSLSLLDSWALLPRFLFP